MRVGWGFDAHRFGGQWPVRLGGVAVETPLLVEATSDGDVAIHAIIDALLGAAALGDLGSFYPSSDEKWHGVASTDLLSDTVRRINEIGSIQNVDVTVISQSVKVAPVRKVMQSTLADLLGVDASAVSIKATTTDHLGAIGRDEGIAAMAVAVIQPLVLS